MAPSVSGFAICVVLWMSPRNIFSLQASRTKLRHDPSRSASVRFASSVDAVDDPIASLPGITPLRASEFEISRYLGSLGFVEVTDWDYYYEGYEGKREGSAKPNPLDPRTPKRTMADSAETVRLFMGQSVVDGRRVLLKEFSRAATSCAVAEAQSVIKLGETWDRNPERKEQGLIRPFASLVGCLTSKQGFQDKFFRSMWVREFGANVPPPLEGSTWLVFSWEGWQNNLATWPSRPQTSLAMDFFMPKLKLQRRLGYFKAAARVTLGTLAFAHDEAGLVHRAIGPASWLLSTNDERSSDGLRVKLIDWGFSQGLADIDSVTLGRALRAGANSPGAINAWSTCEDVYALGLVLVELYFTAMAQVDTQQSRASDVTAVGQFQRLWEDIFDGEIGKLRAYCLEEVAWEDAVDILDENDAIGWEFFQALLGAKRGVSYSMSAVSARSLMSNAFIDK